MSAICPAIPASARRAKQAGLCAHGPCPTPSTSRDLYAPALRRHIDGRVDAYNAIAMTAQSPHRASAT